MSTEEQAPLLAVDPDVTVRRSGRGSTARMGAARDSVADRAGDGTSTGMMVSAAEATLSLEPLRLPIASMVESTLRAERVALEHLGTDVRAELAVLRDWQQRDEALRAEQTALYATAAEHWQAAGDHALTLCRHMERLEGITAVLHGAVEAAISRFWRRALLAAWAVAFTGLGLVGGLCGVVWVALTHR